MWLSGRTVPSRFLGNKLNNQKYSVLTFIPVVLYNEFRFFFNLFFLVTALSQLIPILKIGRLFSFIANASLGFLVTYLGPLVFVLCITMLKEAFDDFKRFSTDNEMNNKKHEILGANGQVRVISSKDLKVGQIVKVSQNERLPADLLLLYTTERTGSVFIRTDQLDGETDWKLRKAVGITQKV